ncbi:MAG: hypothetical protein FWE79_00535, partial [Firmicutes bacterium]|nr:hypothetical protein [Bacillota bacterium]
ADIQLIYNAAGAVLFTVLLLLLKDHYHIFTFGIKNNPAFEVSMFHLVFNLLSGLLFLPFMHKLIKE